jgi:hypothetical protein
MVLIMEDFLVSRSMAKSTCEFFSALMRLEYADGWFFKDAALAVALWDWILCLPDEVDFIWRCVATMKGIPRVNAPG